MKICICASMAAYAQFQELKKELESLGHTVLAPEIEFETKDTKDTSVGRYFETHGGIDAFPPEHEIWDKKGNAIRTHFKKIDESDCVLIANYEKKGIPNYIGANSFLEMGHAFEKGKPIFILHNLPVQSPYKEEMLGMRPIILKGDLNRLA